VTWCFGLIFMVCQAQPLPAATAGATFCSVAKPVQWHANDTRRTKEQADTHNRKWKALCQPKMN
jgi:hypothetical protein